MVQGFLNPDSANNPVYNMLARCLPTLSSINFFFFLSKALCFLMLWIGILKSEQRGNCATQSDGNFSNLCIFRSHSYACDVISTSLCRLPDIMLPGSWQCIPFRYGCFFFICVLRWNCFCYCT